MKKFTDIGQFRNIVKAVKYSHDYQGKDDNGDAIYLHTEPYSTLRFRGTIKLHGTNSGIAAYKTQEDGSLSYEFQCRERVLTLQHDNSAFMFNMQGKDYQKLFDGIEFKESCVIYGEWCGQGIQKNVAISKLTKMFVIFAVRIDDVYQDMDKFKHLKIEEQRIFNIMQFKTFYVDIDFNQPELSQNEIVKQTLEVEEECPVGKYFGISGCGEGIVYELVSNDLRYVFKSKGLKHASGSKPKILNPVDDEKITKLREIAEQVTPVWRLSQMVEQTCQLNNGGTLERNKLGDFIRLVINDVLKEDLDILIDNGIEPKEINKYISEIARMYFFELEKSESNF